MDKMTEQDGMSLDVVGENIQALKTIFPEAFTEDKVDFDVLRQLLGDAVDEGEEKYGLNWHGKKNARQIALTPSNGTLRPCPEESVDWDTTQNLFIEGDNLEVLKLLQKSYANKVKVIYIDPPYNTGNEFIYPDRFQDNLDTYLKYTGQKGKEGLKTSSNTESSGRYHTNWLNMLYPRLKLARNFLCDDGVLLISIDDTEMGSLRKICDEVFGEENFIGSIIWQGGRKNDSKRLSVVHDYILVYVKNENYLKENEIKWREKKEGLDVIYRKIDELRDKHGSDFSTATQELRSWFDSLPDASPAKEHSHYKNLDADGIFYGDNISSPNYRANLIFDWKGYKPPKNGWRYNQAAMEKLDREGLLLYPESKDKRIQYKRYLHNTEEWAPSTWLYKDRRAATKSLTQLMGEKIFDFPKDTSVIKRFIKIFSDENDLVFDFFSGSCPTAQATYDLNREENSNRKFIMVQLPEQCDEKSAAFKSGYPTIAEIGKERIRRAAAKIKEENPDYAGDLGFKVFRLDSSNIRVWNPDRNDLEGTLYEHTEHLVPNRTEKDVLYELLLKRGVDLPVPIESKEIGGKTIYSIGYGVLFACLNSDINRDEIEDVAQAIVAWHKELAPASDTQVVFRDSSFADDVAKTNMTAILEQNGIKHVRSL